VIDRYDLKLTLLSATPHASGLVAYIIAKESPAPEEIRNRIVELTTKDKIQEPKESPNRVANNGNGIS